MEPDKSIGHNMLWRDQYPIKNKQEEMADHHGNVHWCYNVTDQNNQKFIHQEKGESMRVLSYIKSLS